VEPGATPLDSTGAWDDDLRRREPQGVDAAFDSFGGRSLERSWKVLGPRGTLVSYGFSPTPGGGWGPLLAGLASVALKAVVPTGRRARVCGTPRIVNADRAWYRTTLAALFDRAARGEIRPRLHAVLPWTEAAEAHRRIIERQAAGKMLLEFPG
jgi:NADPH:quinone reductase-like Zn-dependent oxidoreductase